MIVCSVGANTKEGALKSMLISSSKADAVEIRLDYIDDLDTDFIHDINSKKVKPLILTCRGNKEGGNFKGGEDKRISIIKNCIDAGADYVDIELSTGEETINEIINNKKETKIILSYHNFDGIPEDIDNIYSDMKCKGVDVIKIACMANKLKDNLSMFSLLDKAKKENTHLIGICMGEKGTPSRILALAKGSFMTYGCLYEPVAPGQIMVEHLKRVYRADKIDLDNWKVFGLVGNPVDKSRGFLVHNLTFKEKDIDAVYINFLVDNLEEFVKDFKNLLSGFSVTMPHKKEIIKYLDGTDEITKKIGAVNTVVKKDGKLIGYNTDSTGAIDAILEITPIRGKNVVILGAGGTAKAIGYGIMINNGKLTITNRTIEKGKNLAVELGCEFKTLDKISWTDVDLLINSTSVGMMPDIHAIPIDNTCLKNMIVFDAIYNPLVTKLIHEAEKRGCKTIQGIKMFINQAAGQFEIFIGKKADKDFMERKVLEYVVG